MGDLHADLAALRDEYRRSTNPPPYTSERALIERMEALLAAHTPPSEPATEGEGHQYRGGWCSCGFASCDRDSHLEHVAQVARPAGAVRAQPEGSERVEWGVRTRAGRVLSSSGDPWSSLADLREAFGSDMEITAPLVTRTVTEFAPVVGEWTEVDIDE